MNDDKKETRNDDAAHESEAVPNTQSSASVETPTYGPRELKEHYFAEANHHYDELVGLQQRSLCKAKLIGDYLNRAKNLLLADQEYEEWLPTLEKRFKGSVRNAQNYMEIARRWRELEPEIARNPGLSIDGALAFLRRGNLLEKLIKGWTDQEKEWMRQDPEMFPPAMNELRDRLRRKHEGLTFIESHEQEERASERYRLKLQTQREVLKEFEPGWKITDELIPQDSVNWFPMMASGKREERANDNHTTEPQPQAEASSEAVGRGGDA